MLLPKRNEIRCWILKGSASLQPNIQALLQILYVVRTQLVFIDQWTSRCTYLGSLLLDIWDLLLSFQNLSPIYWMCFQLFLALPYTKCSFYLRLNSVLLVSRFCFVLQEIERTKQYHVFFDFPFIVN